MPLILNIETATTNCSVALAKDGKVLSLVELNEGYSHAENLTVFIERALQEAGIKFAELDAIAVSKGPGSYTGLRIGVSATKGLCYALNKPLIGISTLQAMAQEESRSYQDKNVLFCPMIDARRMEVYCALYNMNNVEVRGIKAEIIDENSFAEELSKNKIVFFGDGAIKCKPFIGNHPNAVFVENIFPSAKAMAGLSENAFSKKQFEDLAYFEPFYLKEFVTGVKKT